MSSFTFNFNIIQQPLEYNNYICNQSVSTPSPTINSSMNCRIVSAEANLLIPCKKNSVSITIGGKVFCKAVTAVDSVYDIVPSVYEGGLKLWECSRDLAELLIADSEHYDFGGPAVELGCGHGFPGICAMLLNFSPVFFSDLNDEVLERVTWSNISSNCPDLTTNAICVSGDWDSLSQSGIIPLECNLILSAETLYTSANCEKVYSFIARHLSVHGIALVATKRYYFGVGGGSLDLLQRVQEGERLSAAVVRVFEDGQSNIREIIEIRRRADTYMAAKTLQGDS